MSMPPFNRTFLALLKEAQFTKEMLGAGATQIRVGNYASKGVYFQAFTSLATGLERIGKLCLILDHFIETGGRFPDRDVLRSEIGHRLTLLHSRTQLIVRRRRMVLTFLQSLDNVVDLSIIQVLSDFADGDRYSNIDFLVGAASDDPVAAWFNQVDRPLYEMSVSRKKKETIQENARIVAAMLGPISYVRHSAEDGKVITDVMDASERTGMFEAVAPLRQLHVLQIIRYWVEVLGELQQTAQRLPGEKIPFFSELFAMFYNDDRFFRSRKTWDS